MPNRLKFWFLLIAASLQIACSEHPQTSPSCRIIKSELSEQKGPAACLIRVNQSLLVAKLQDNKYDLIKTQNLSDKNAQCALHASVFVQTGLNVEVGRLLTNTDNNMQIFECRADASFNGTESEFKPFKQTNLVEPSNQHAAPAKIQTLKFIDPFKIDKYDWAQVNDLAHVRRAYLQLSTQSDTSK